MITAYEMKTKTKNVEMLNAVITQTSKGGYMAKGVSKNGNSMVTMLSKVNAEKAIKEGCAVKG